MVRDPQKPGKRARLEKIQKKNPAPGRKKGAGGNLTQFFDAAALVSDADSFEDKPGVTLITLHSTKGLEFDHVFLTGMEEGICPHGRSINEEKGVEEERR